MRKIKVGVIYGGRSAEHEVSLQSAKNVINAIDKDKYEIILIRIDKNGCWHLNKSNFSLNLVNSKSSKSEDKLALIPGTKSGSLFNISKQQVLDEIEVIFPILHGPYGEDGTVQGMLKLINIPFVGSSVLGSAIGMDKDITKRLLRDAGISIPKFLVFKNSNMSNLKFQKIKKQLGIPIFIKPASLGSSVGISKVYNKREFLKALDLALQFDNKVILEENIKGREIECSILGNEELIVSEPGEILPNDKFYSYEAKYIDKDGAILDIPAKLDEDNKRKIKNLAKKIFKVLCCKGMARVDLFLKENNKVIVNEINTIPGFTKISMYPKLWEVSGISYSELINKLIKLAIKRFENEQKLRTRKNFN